MNARYIVLNVFYKSTIFGSFNVIRNVKYEIYYYYLFMLVAIDIKLTIFGMSDDEFLLLLSRSFSNCTISCVCACVENNREHRKRQTTFYRSRCPDTVKRRY